MKHPKLYNVIFWALIFLFFGLTSSPTLVAGYHILIFIPAIILFKNKLRYPLSYSSCSLIGLVLWGMIATLYNLEDVVRPNKSFQELKYYFFAVFSIGCVGYFFKYADDKKKKILLNLLLFTIVVGFFVGISRSKFSFDPVKWEFVPGKYHTRVGGFTNYMRYGYSSALLFVIGVGAVINYKSIKDLVGKYWLSTFMSFNILAVIFSETRGAILVILSGTSFLLLKYRPRIGKSLIGLGIMGVLTILVISLTQSSSNRYLNIKDGSNKIRLSQFYSAAMAIKDNPVFGLGADQFSYNVTKIKNKYDIWSKEYSGHSHNIFLEHAANYGLIGLLLFLGFLIFWFMELIKLGTDEGWIIASYLVGFVVGGQVELLFDVINSHLIFFLYAYSKRNSITFVEPAQG